MDTVVTCTLVNGETVSGLFGGNLIIRSRQIEIGMIDPANR